MRRSISKIPYRSATTPSSISAAAFSTGGGRGRGGPTHFQFNADDDHQNPPPQGQGRGRGRGFPVPPSSGLPSFSPFVNNNPSSAAFGHGHGRGRGFGPPTPTSPPGEDPPKPNVKAPAFMLGKDEISKYEPEAPHVEKNSLPSSIFDVMSGAGRGKPGQSPAPQPERPKEEARQTRAREQSHSTRDTAREQLSSEGKVRQAPAKEQSRSTKDTAREQLSNEEKVRKAVNILSKGDVGGGSGAPGDSRFRATSGERGMGRGRGSGRGQGSSRGRGRGRGRGGYGGRGNEYVERDDELDPQVLGDPAAEEKVAKKLGPEIMAKLAEGLDEMSSRVLPSPYNEALIDAYEMNLMLECEPEYFMEEFGTNPDIDEKPPIPLRDALEKMKPFLMAYEGIQSQEEWEEIIEETMKTVPLMKEIVDHYGGPDRVTAKQQTEELERVAKTLPASAPASVKRFTDRAVLSLQSNPGWGFDKKCQFMDKLIMEVSQQYK